MDLGSSNGTFVNGKKLDPDTAVKVSIGDVIQTYHWNLKSNKQQLKNYLAQESNLGKSKNQQRRSGLVQNTLVCDTPVKSYFDLDVEAPVIAAIADGMGGLDDGEIASMVIDSLRDWLETAPPDAGSEEIIASFNRWIPITNDKIISACHTRGMGTTLVGLVFTRHAVLGFNVGDSRLYRFREGWLRQISADHSQRHLTGDPLYSNQSYL